MSHTQTATTSLPSVSEDMSSTSSAVTCSVNTPTTSSSETHSCPYKDCNKSFSKKYNLKAHLRLHTGEEPFECDRPDCRKKFKWRSSLSSHSVWHTRKDNASASQPTSTNTTKSTSPVTKPVCSQKASSSRAIRLAPNPNTQHGNLNSSSVSGSGSSPNCRKKRPRSEVNSRDVDQSGLSSSSRVKSCKAVRPAAKKRRARSAGQTKNSDVSKQCHNTQSKSSMVCGQGEDVDGLTESILMAPGSPVTSDGSHSDQGLDVEEFSCDILQPLLDRGETLELGAGSEVEAMIGAEDGQLFGYDDSVSCVPLGGFDSRFEQFDLDNFANFYLNKMEGL